jgi:hypothetical protein
MFDLIKLAFGFYPKNPKFYSKYPFAILKNKKATEEQKAEAIKANPTLIAFIKKPSFNLKKIAIDQDSVAFLHIKDKADVWDYYTDKYGYSLIIEKDNIPARIQIKMFKNGHFIQKPCKQVQHLIYNKFGLATVNILRFEYGFCNSLQKRIVEDYIKDYKYYNYLNYEIISVLNAKNRNYLSKLLILL